ncbi:MAG: hypothetical protein ACK4HU_15225 [Algoriphagus sp.]
MISGFICASYFVTIRVVNFTSMGFFRMITPSEHLAFLVSDMFVWLVPLAIIWMIWLRKDYNFRNNRKSVMDQIHSKG